MYSSARSVIVSPARLGSKRTVPPPLTIEATAHSSDPGSKPPLVLVTVTTWPRLCADACARAAGDVVGAAGSSAQAPSAAMIAATSARLSASGQRLARGMTGCIWLSPRLLVGAASL
jgi:hypothetical protein